MGYLSELIYKSEGKIILYGVLIFLLVNYIVALYKSRKGTIVAISGWFDLFLVLTPVLAFIVVLLSLKDNNKEYNNQIFTYYGVVSGIAILWTFINSVIANTGNVFNIIVSFFSKFFVMLISVLLILMVFSISNSKKDDEYKSSKNENSHTIWKMLSIGILGFLIFSLVKNKKKNTSLINKGYLYSSKNF